MSAGARGSTEQPSAGPSRAGWYLLPLAWCLWLLVWLAPSMLIAPHLGYVRPWLALETAPTALLAAAALFLVTVWPFWPALAAGTEDRRAALVGRSVAELAILLALAAPFLIVAAAVGGLPLSAGPLIAAAAVPAALGLGLRLAVAGLGQKSMPWIIATALCVAAVPVLVAYAVCDSLLGAYPGILEISPVIASVNLATDGWPLTGMSWLFEVALWPVVGAVFAIAGLLRLRRN
jgi:hypothetical protein